MAQKPMWEAMKIYDEQQVYPLHTPGHKGGLGTTPELQELLTPTGLRMDVSLMSELDDIHCPSGCLQQAQAAAAKLYGADASFFAVNGTTGAIHAMVMGALKPGDKILVPRNAHASVMGALILAHLEPVYIMPEFDEQWGLQLQLTPEAVAYTLERDYAIKGILVTSPNYYGLTADIAVLADLAHKRNIPLLVDEAHGPHLGVSDKLPPSALSQGADAVAQSTHKILGALTQCSMLHMREGILHKEQVAAAVSLLTTTSPNNIFLASLDLARAQVEEYGEAMVNAAVRSAQKLRVALDTVPSVKVLRNELLGQGGVVGYDASKVVLNVRGTGYAGMEVADYLRQHKIAVELADRDNVLFLVTYADAKGDWLATVDNIVTHMRELAQYPKTPLEAVSGGIPRPLPVFNPVKAFYAEKEAKSILQAVGEISGETISFYPPGIPVVVPGERITSDIIDYCRRMLEAGMSVSGPSDSSLTTIRVVKR